MGRTPTFVIGGCAGVTFLGLVSLLLLASVITAFVTPPQGVGAGGGGINPCIASVPTSIVKPTATPSKGAAGCLPPSGIEASVVQLALHMATHLYVNPLCHGTISYPYCYYTWYDSGFPPEVVAYAEQVCPGCAAWANGTYQCVSFVRGAYSQAYPMDQAANAFDLWSVYQGKRGWTEIPSAAAPPGQRGLPYPGDVIVWADASVGHVAIATSVLPPHDGQNGQITFANANSVTPLDSMILHPDLSVSTWSGYTVWGYIRPAPAK